jgi:hypothetical protein
MPKKKRMSKEVTLATYNLQVLGPANADGSHPRVTLTNALLRETEENLSDLLQPFRVVIREWDDETNEPRRLT